MNQPSINKNFFFIFVISVIFLSANALALKTDSEKPIFISSDKAECQQKTLFCTYVGDVKFEQGTSFLGAPKILVYKNNKSDGIDKLVAIGSPAHFHTMLDHALFQKKQTLIYAEGETIKIYPGKGLIVLNGKALIKEDDNRFSSEHIEYDINKQTVLSRPTNNSRTKIVIQPQNQK